MSVSYSEYNLLIVNTLFLLSILRGIKMWVYLDKLEFKKST